MGSHRWSPGLWWGSGSPCNPRFVQLCGSGPCDPRNLHNRLHHECDKGKWDGHASDTLGQCPGSLHFGVWWATATVEDDMVTTKVLDPTEYDEVVTTKESKMIDAFSSKIIHMRTKTAFTRARLNVMTQGLCAEEGSLSQCLMIQHTYTKMHNGSKCVTVVVRNGTAFPQALKKKIPVARVVAANHMPEAWMQPGMIDAFDEVHGIQTPRDDHGAEAGKAAWEVWPEQPRILTARAGKLCSFPPCQVSWHFFLRILWAQLYTFNWTCD